MNTTVGNSLTTAQFDDLRRVVNRRFGLHLQDADRRFISNRLQERLDILNLDNFDDYIACLTAIDGSEITRAIDMLTNNETYFFREDYQLNAFCAELLPQLHVQKVRGGRLSIWSAGCSSGEEAYTVAILIRESRLFENKTVRILGTDISSRRLSMARTGVYRPSAFRTTPDALQTRYFVSTSDGFQIRDDIKEMCAFSKLNLADRDGIVLAGRFDVIFCRNVLIYFDRESRRKCLQTLYRRLLPGGYLLLGHTESLLNEHTGFLPVHLRETLVYQRPNNEDEYLDE